MGKDLHGKVSARVIAGLESQGVETRRLSSGGWRINFPNGTSTVLHRSLSDVRSVLNFKADVKRGGCLWPLDKGFKRRNKNSTVD